MLPCATQYPSVGIENFPVSGGFNLIERERGLTCSAEKIVSRSFPDCLKDWSVCVLVVTIGVPLVVSRFSFSLVVSPLGLVLSSLACIVFGFSLPSLVLELNSG